jgi:non-specific serine/threonine protein kinase
MICQVSRTQQNLGEERDTVDAGIDNGPQAVPFGLLVRRHRLAQSLSQEALAERAGISPRCLSEIERGGPHRPRRDTVALLAEALGLAPSQRAAVERALQLHGTPPVPLASPADDHTSTAPAPAAADTPARGNLPHALSSLIGREQGQAAVRALLEAARLVTLTGAGGAGKTRLALAVAAGLADRYADGVWLVELAALPEPGLVPGAVARALGLREEPGRAMLDTLAAYLRERHLLLVLDNCEHLLDICAALASALLRACPHLRLLATSREALGLTGEHLYRVPSLSVPDPRHLPAPELAGTYEAVRLFVARARERRSEFALSAQNARAVAQICARLDGMPLAIELAAARVGAMSVETIAARLDDRFALLTGGARDALPRQQTLRATLDWSYELLGTVERVLLGRLAVFAGGWTLEAAEAVCAGEGIDEGSVLDLLDGLAHKSLVQADEEVEGELRYRLLETVRQYGQERLAAAGEAVEVQRRHAQWFLALAEKAEPQLKGAEQLAWLARLEREHDNLRAALRWIREAGDVVSALRLAGALSRFWEVSGRLSEGQTWLDDLLALPAPEGPVALATRAKALQGTGVLAFRQGHYAQATRRAQGSLAVHRALGDTRGIAGALNTLGIVAIDQGDFARAAPLLEESLGLKRALGDRRGMAVALDNLAQVARHVGTPERASELLDQSLRLNRELGDMVSLATSLCNRGDLACDQRDYRWAADLYRESLALVERRGLGFLVAHCLEGLAQVVAVQGDLCGAVRLCGAAWEIRERVKSPRAPAERGGYEQLVARLRAALREDVFACEWTVGRALPLDQAITYAQGPSEH